MHLKASKNRANSGTLRNHLDLPLTRFERNLQQFGHCTYSKSTTKRAKPTVQYSGRIQKLLAAWGRQAGEKYFANYLETEEVVLTFLAS